MCACSVNAWHKWCQAALMRELQRLEIVKASAAAGKALSWAAICSCEKNPKVLRSSLPETLDSQRIRASMALWHVFRPLNRCMRMDDCGRTIQALGFRV